MKNRINKRQIYAMYHARYMRLAAEERAWLDPIGLDWGVGSDFDDFLGEGGIFEEVAAGAVKKVVACMIEQAIAERSLDAKNAVYEADDGPLTQETRDWLRSSAKGQMPKGKLIAKKRFYSVQ